jgi:mannose-6-phosphate isomerase-like protein (cupin superfamily)
MEEEWRNVKGFPHYEVSNFGNVRRIGNIENLVPKKAKGNAWFVKLSHGGVNTSKTLKTLVAEAFVEKPVNYIGDLFDTPIQLVLNTDEVRADKIQWRPRWFAIKYRRELNDPPYYYDVPVMNIDTGNQHASILTAALHDGVLMSDIHRSATEGRKVFPTHHRYDFMWYIEKGFGSVHTEGV